MNNIFSDIPADLTEEVFEVLVENDEIHIERIISNGQVTPEGKWYDQEKNEWVLILKGSAKLKFENEAPTELKAGNYINIPAHKKHRVEWTATDTLWLAIHY